MMDINWRPDKNDLRKFGDISLAMFLVIGLVMHWLDRVSAETALYIATAGLVIYVISRTVVWGVKPVYLAAYGLTYPLGWVISHLILGLIYYVVVTPIGLIFRLMGRDLLHRRYDSTAESYWVDHAPAGDVKRYFRQF
jgi:hypothetical protein